MSNRRATATRRGDRHPFGACCVNAMLDEESWLDHFGRRVELARLVIREYGPKDRPGWWDRWYEERRGRPPASG